MANADGDSDREDQPGGGFGSFDFVILLQRRAIDRPRGRLCLSGDHLARFVRLFLAREAGREQFLAPELLIEQLRKHLIARAAAQISDHARERHKWQQEESEVRLVDKRRADRDGCTREGRPHHPVPRAPQAELPSGKAEE